VCDRRRAGERGRRGQLPPQAPEHERARRLGEEAEQPPERRARDGGHRVGVEGEVSERRREQPRVVEHERDADHRHVVGQRRLRLDREPPAERRRRLQQRPRARGAERLRASRREQRAGAAVHDGLRSRDDDHQIRLDERRVHAERHASRRADVDERGVLDVVDDQLAPEASGEVGRKEQRQLLRPRLARKPAGDEQRLPLGRHAERRELIGDALDRLAPRVGRGAGDRQVRQFDHDRRAAPAPRELVQGRPLEWEPQRLPHGRPHVVERLAGRGRLQHDAVIGQVHDGDAGAGEQGHLPHASELTVLETSG
jgi:hypothetical protein